MNLSSSIQPRSRVSSIDIVRGLVIMLMALDHTRDFWGATQFSPEDPSQSNTAWFFTRWITHFCAPVFIFLSGTSAFLYGQKTGKSKLAVFLLMRGFWLILAEIFLVNPGWTFLFPWQSGIVMLQVIWVIGWSMIVLAGLIYLNWRIILALSLLVICMHNLFDRGHQDMHLMPDWQQFLHAEFTEMILWKNPKIEGVFVYPLVPWFAIMSLGYVAGKLYQEPSELRKKVLTFSAVSAILLFLILRAFNAYGDRNKWMKADSAEKTVLDFLDISKYPPSLFYVLIMLGIALLILVWSENWNNRFARIAMVYGQVPFFFYLVHTPVINGAARIYHYLAYGRAFTFVGSGEEWPQEYQPKLWLVYLVWILVLVLLYFLCSWYGNYKRRHSYWWLKYV